LQNLGLSHYTDKIITVSEGVKEFYANEVGINAEKFMVIRNGIEINQPQAAGYRLQVREELGINNDEKILGVVGRLVPQKRHR
jgi:glycosyltransferase involved in cell wall biosynthesis